MSRPSAATSRPVRPSRAVRTQVGIVGAGPAGLLLSHLLALRGIGSVIVEIRSRAYCEARQRAGVLESGSVQVLREAGLAARLDRHGLEHGGIYLQFGGQRRHLDFRDLTGRTVTVYAQTEIVKDLIAARIAAGGVIEFEVSDTEVDALDTDRPVLRYTRADGTRHEMECDAIAGCDGFHGICRDAIPARLQTVWETGYPYAWLGTLAGLLASGRTELADAYSDSCLDRVWRATHFSWWMTSMLHATPGAGPMEGQLQLSQLRYVTSSRAAATSLAENYVGYRPVPMPG